MRYNGEYNLNLIVFGIAVVVILIGAFIASQQKSKKLSLYDKDILSNTNLTSMELITFIVHCPKLSEKHAQMIRKSNGFNRLVEVLLKENCPAA